MSKTTEHPEVRAVEDAAWRLKEAASDLYGRSLSGPDKAALASVLRDLARLQERVVAIRDKRKRNVAETQPELEVPEAS